MQEFTLMKKNLTDFMAGQLKTIHKIKKGCA